MISRRDPRITPAVGDMYRKETDHLGRVLVCEIISIDRYGIRYTANGAQQSSCSVEAWRQFAKDSELIHEGTV